MIALLKIIKRNNPQVTKLRYSMDSFFFETAVNKVLNTIEKLSYLSFSRQPVTHPLMRINLYVPSDSHL